MQTLTVPDGPFIVCAAALPAELAGLRRCMTVEETRNYSGITWYQGHSHGQNLLLVQTGMGRKAAERAGRIILDRYSPAALISFGFAGGLSKRLEAGSLVLCRQLYAEGDMRSRPVVCSDIGLLTLAQAQQANGKAPLLGSSVTVDRVVSRPEEKRVLGETYQADVLEMESYWIGRVCAERQVAFLAVRAVSDEAGQELPPVERMVGPSGEVRWGAALCYFARHPRALAGVMHFAQTARTAERQLTGFLCAFFQSLGEE